MSDLDDYKLVVVFYYLCVSVVVALADYFRECKSKSFYLSHFSNILGHVMAF